MLTRDSLCPCGSGKRYKKCCGRGQAGPPSLHFNVPVHGLPGQRGKLYIVPGFAHGDPRNPQPEGSPGEYKVVLTLARPGYDLTAENRICSADQLTGTSHLQLRQNMLIDATMDDGADPAVPRVPCGLSPISRPVSCGPLPARVLHTLLDSWHTSSPRGVRASAGCKGKLKFGRITQPVANLRSFGAKFVL